MGIAEHECDRRVTGYYDDLPNIKTLKRVADRFLSLHDKNWDGGGLTLNEYEEYMSIKYLFECKEMQYIALRG